MKRWLIGASIALLAIAAQALPTVAEVQTQVDKGNNAQAETMMREVVAARPGSAKAHYVYAEILARNARFADASRETALARQIDPAIKFTRPEQFRSFEQMLDREQQRARTPAPSTLDRLGPALTTPQRAAPRPVQAVEAPASQPGMPGWVWPVGLGVLAVVAWKMLRRPSAATPAPGVGGPGYATPGGYGQPAGYGPTGGGMSAGGGLMGVGLAAAGGAAAGMLAERLLDRGRDERRSDGFFGNNAGTSDSPAASDDAARALEDRSVDFGTGNDWDAGGSVDAGGGFDGGGGSSDGGW